MNLTIFGANELVGKLVVQRALDEGHQVRAFVHSHDPFDPHVRLRVFAGDVADGDAVEQALGDAAGGADLDGSDRCG